MGLKVCNYYMNMNWLTIQYLGDCIYLTSCPALQKIYEKRPVTLQDRQFLSVRQCGFRDKYPLVCCLETETITTPKPALKIIFPKAIITESQPSSILPSLLPKPGVCGSYEEDYIYRGNETMINEYPWMVLLKYSKRMKIEFLIEHL